MEDWGWDWEEAEGMLKSVSTAIWSFKFEEEEEGKIINKLFGN
jgi:hypothetical protein